MLEGLNKSVPPETESLCAVEMASYSRGQIDLDTTQKHDRICQSKNR